MSLRPIEKAILARAESAGAAGISLSDVTGFEARAVEHAHKVLVREGHLFKAKSGHRTMRLYAREDWAKAFAAGRVEPYIAPRPGQPSVCSGPRDYKGAYMKGEVIYPTDENGNPLYKITIGPSLNGNPTRTNTHAIY